jgi:hypothetical protein
MREAFSIRNVIALFSLTLLLSSLTIAITLLNKTKNTPEVAKTNPRLILWAWERPTDLRFIDTKKVAVAFLARSIQLTADEVKVRPRLQPLQLPDGTKVIAVARIETDRDQKPLLSDRQRDVTARTIADLSSLPNVSEVQIDYDATLSQRNFYRELITDVRQRLPRGTRLSITALASWCMHDDWLSKLPIDEAVPMLFRMAADGKQVLNQLEAGDDFIATPCRQGYGIALDEPRPKMFPDRKLFVFNPRAWTESTVREISEPK